MRRDLRLWERLVTFLAQHGHVHEPAAGRLVFTMSGTGRRVEIVVTPQEWADLVDMTWGDLRPAAEEVLRVVAESEPLERYLVYETYDLVPCSEPTLPADPCLDDGRRGSWHARDPTELT